MLENDSSVAAAKTTSAKLKARRVLTSGATNSAKTSSNSFSRA